eukprot:CAMPEP_0194289954 /NCGR_PEP_ID=MMETSP0169-20130528/40254_1 /TAXON_ID=218684 /ORGANISM="Corethron pennatum, Strain L29A3" /LENGTH=41 /DNA_ID= /DNA_START= /DNA_END= /DNA_ORIENTATION=
MGFHLVIREQKHVPERALLAEHTDRTFGDLAAKFPLPEPTV